MAQRPAAERREDLVALLRDMKEHHECPLKDQRTTLVFGAGNADADLMFVGEAPGFNEDQQGLPFVGRAGKLLDELLAGIGLERRDTFICNVLKCRPPGNRDPLPEEIEICKPYLYKQVELIEPLVVGTLGNFATKLLTRSNRGIMSCHGAPQRHELGGRTVTIFPLCHPAAGLRTPATLQLLREDFARIPALLEEERRRGQPQAEEPPEDPEPEPVDQLGLFG